MKRVRIIPTVGIMVVLGWTLGGCTSNPLSLEGGPIVTASNSWADESDNNHTFLLASSYDGKDRGQFTGSEALGAESFQLTGLWWNGKIGFTVNRSQPVTYSADVDSDNPTRLVFHSGSETLVLVRNVAALRRSPGTSNGRARE